MFSHRIDTVTNNSWAQIISQPLFFSIYLFDFNF